MDKRIALGKMKVSDVWHLLVKEPTCVHESTTISDVLAKINEDTKTRHIYVLNEQGRLAGTIRMNTIVKYLFPMSAIIDDMNEAMHDQFLTFHAKSSKDVMNPKPVFVYAETQLSDVANLLLKEKINELPVVDKDMKVIGQVNVYEIIGAYLNNQ
jgi:CBS domain-containing protein